jgi:hypothetical protein
MVLDCPANGKFWAFRDTLAAELKPLRGEADTPGIHTFETLC